MFANEGGQKHLVMDTKDQWDSKGKDGYKLLQRADHSSRGVLPSVVRLNVIVKIQQGGGLGLLGLSSQ